MSCNMPGYWSDGVPMLVVISGPRGALMLETLPNFGPYCRCTYHKDNRNKPVRTVVTDCPLHGEVVAA